MRAYVLHSIYYAAADVRNGNAEYTSRPLLQQFSILSTQIAETDDRFSSPFLSPVGNIFLLRVQTHISLEGGSNLRLERTAQ
jgi:hypothetical protein